MEKEFTGKYAIVTGGARGIGFAAAKVLAQRGLSGVILADMNLETAQKSAEELEAETGCQCYAYQVNVALPENIEALFSMTPYYWKTDVEGGERLRALDVLETEIKFDFLVYRKK